MKNTAFLAVGCVYPPIYLVVNILSVLQASLL